MTKLRGRTTPRTPYDTGYSLGARNIHSAMLPYTDSASYLEFYRGHQAGYAQWRATMATAWQRACYEALERTQGLEPKRKKARAA
ncbi:MAG TPA: hypothetical protein VNL17_14625 [Verrucomicrobiae bacterium]|nr:hypothetical protein [Verrucomicrobiae bacterium]